MKQKLCNLSNDIFALRAKLHSALDCNSALNDREVYHLSVKLDKLIYEYEKCASVELEKMR
ncbi:MAG: Spo0E family sporulation regulatory protein-aspartic acid phosphatase [Thermoanaerobacterales bacterium]|jgi:hypothetical protein|nr:Spo0E family sporulation regulatory protein-aspartic acid phosphatase [Thermoanaerobacterales bacterium]